MSYEPRRPARQEMLLIRGLMHRVLRWGPESDDPVLLLHGWADSADSFQFIADEIAPALPLAALDWRGFGHSEWSPAGYWFPDYYADLEQLLDQLVPGGRGAPRGPQHGRQHRDDLRRHPSRAGPEPRQSRGLRAAAHGSVAGAGSPREMARPAARGAGIQRLRRRRRSGRASAAPQSAPVGGARLIHREAAGPGRCRAGACACAPTRPIASSIPTCTAARRWKPAGAGRRRPC